MYSPPPSIPQMEYAPTVNQQQQQQPEFHQLDSGLTVPVFKQAVRHISQSLLPQPARNSSNPRTYTHRASEAILETKGTIIVTNWQRGGGQMSKQCTKPKRKRDDSWFKDKVLQVQAQANGQILHEEELAFLADPGTTKDNGTEFVNQTLREYYEKVGISHETSAARSPRQNGVVERRNRTLIEVARTILFYAIAPLFLWAKAVATACYTQNRSIIRLRHGKTPYEILYDKLPNLSFFHVFGALCYPI
ncbi:retrovirus-related pol polyprotein from transposon TNT 1-94 [Tanacetum coccineum]